MHQLKLTRDLQSCLISFFAPEIRAWHGKARLGPVFWLYGVLVSSVLVVLYIGSIYGEQVILEQALLIGSEFYMVWILVSIWRCSLAADPFWGLLARWLTVAWALNAAFLLVFLQIDLWTRYPGE